MDKVSLLEMMVSSMKEHGRQEFLILVKSPIMMALITLDKSKRTSSSMARVLFISSNPHSHQLLLNLIKQLYQSKEFGLEILQFLARFILSWRQFFMMALSVIGLLLAMESVFTLMALMMVINLKR